MLKVAQVFNLIFSWFSLGNYYITFVILSNAMEDPSFKIPEIRWVNDVLEYLYGGLLVMCFLLSLGNRPQGSKWGYTGAIIGFGFITIYMTVFAHSANTQRIRELMFSQFAAFFLAFKSVENLEAAKGPLNADSIFTEPIFRNVVISLAATLGLYFISSLLFVGDLLGTKIDADE
jgi:chitin synthase